MKNVVQATKEIFMRFSIREVLLLTAIASVLGAWWLDHRWLALELARLRQSWPSFLEYPQSAGGLIINILMWAMLLGAVAYVLSLCAKTSRDTNTPTPPATDSTDKDTE
jgi:hypothetical protein